MDKKTWKSMSREEKYEYVRYHAFKYGELVMDSIESYNCYDCPENSFCEWAFDPYNTGSDCIASK